MACFEPHLYCECGYSDGYSYTVTTMGCTCDHTCIALPHSTKSNTYVISSNDRRFDYPEDKDLAAIFKARDERIRRLEFRFVNVLQAQRHRQALVNSKRRWRDIPQCRKILPRTIHNAMMLARAKEN